MNEQNRNQSKPIKRGYFVGIESDAEIEFRQTASQTGRKNRKPTKKKGKTAL